MKGEKGKDGRKEGDGKSNEEQWDNTVGRRKERGYRRDGGNVKE